MISDEQIEELWKIGFSHVVIDLASFRDKLQKILEEAHAAGVAGERKRLQDIYIGAMVDYGHQPIAILDRLKDAIDGKN